MNERGSDLYPAVGRRDRCYSADYGVIVKGASCGSAPPATTIPMSSTGHSFREHGAVRQRRPWGAGHPGRTPPGRLMKTKTPKVQLDEFLAKYSPEIAALARAVHRKMPAQLPGAVELVYDNYNALVIGFGPSERASEAIFSIALYRALDQPVLPAWRGPARSEAAAQGQRQGRPSRRHQECGRTG